MAHKLYNLIPQILKESYYQRGIVICYNLHFVRLIRSYCSRSADQDNASESKALSKNDAVEEMEAKTAHANSIDNNKDGTSEDTKDVVQEKLSKLLSETLAVDRSQIKPTRLNLSRPNKRISKKERFPSPVQEKRDSHDELLVAIKAVASRLKGDPMKIEAELSEKVKSISPNQQFAQEEITIPQKERHTELDNEINQHLMSSVKEVASALTGNTNEAKSDLTMRLLRLKADILGRSVPKVERNDKVSQGAQLPPIMTEEEKLELKKRVLKVKAGLDEPNVPRVSMDKGNRVDRKMIMAEHKIKPTLRVSEHPKVNLFLSSPLNIFDSENESQEVKNKTWEALHQRELKLMVQFAPTNAFEEMIMWTEQGKHWKLPIDNEVDMGPEEKVGFHEHVFLDHHLKGFPTKGPIRHFMELVVVGLSKNPYITVERKVENIEWFRQYFKEKEDILKEYGVLD